MKSCSAPRFVNLWIGAVLYYFTQNAFHLCLVSHLAGHSRREPKRRDARKLQPATAPATPVAKDPTDMSPR